MARQPVVDRLAGAFLLLLAVGQPLAGGFAGITGIGTPIGARSDTIGAAITPAGYAFGIWSVIFALSIAFAVAALWPRAAADPALSAMRLPLAGAFTANIAWMLHVQLNALDWVSQAIITVLLGCVLAAVFAADRAQPSRLSRRLLWPLAGLFAGWVTAATFVGLGNQLLRAGVPGFGAEAMAGPLLLLATAGLVAAFVARRLRQRIWYVAAVCWALVGVAVKGAALAMLALIAAALLLAALVVAAAAVLPKPRAA